MYGWTELAWLCVHHDNFQASSYIYRTLTVYQVSKTYTYSVLSPRTLTVCAVPRNLMFNIRIKIKIIIMAYSTKAYSMLILCIPYLYTIID